MTIQRTAFGGSRLLLSAMLLGGSSLAIAQTAPIVLPGAPGQDSRTLSAAEATDLAKVTFTDADVTFMQGMIVHHQQAVVMAELVEDRTNLEGLSLIHI